MVSLPFEQTDDKQIIMSKKTPELSYPANTEQNASYTPTHGFKDDLQVQMRWQLFKMQAVHKFGRKCEQPLELIDIRCCWIKSAYSDQGMSAQQPRKRQRLYQIS